MGARRGSDAATIAAAAVTLVASASANAAEYCATQPPPDGLVPRCRQLDMLVPQSAADLSVRLARWMQTCAIRKRGDSLVFGNPSVDAVWSKLENRRGSLQGVRILPKYVPNQYTSNGKTCYGIASVRFVVAGTEVSVDADGEDMTVTRLERLDQYPEEQIREAAEFAQKALLADPETGYEKQKMLSVLQRMRSYGPEFDDVYYNLGPYTTFGDWNDPTCYKELRAGAYQCRALDDARDSCAVHLGPRILDVYFSGASPQQMAQHLLSYARDIRRGLDHLHLIQAQDTPGAVPCESVEKVFIPEVRRMAQSDRQLYNAWDAVPR